eukprot:XP_011603893.1 PREDICTED: proline and serine-rich protein 3 isoform X1 [Takifugu rubripes]
MRARRAVLGVTDEQPVFTELWPASTDCESSPTSCTALDNMDSMAHKVKSGKTGIFSEQGNWRESYLTKHTEHFCDSPPQRREEQTDYSMDEQQLSFWQTSPSSVPPSSTPTKTADTDDYQSPFFSPAEGCFSPWRELPSIPSEGEADDTEILDLQERANRLLLREECITDGSIHASLEGLGCSDFSSTASNDELQRRPFIPGIKISEDKRKARSDSEPAASSQKSFIPPSLVNPQRPEEDILFQWRLRRKMEQAREGPWHMQHTRLHGPTVSWQTPALNHPPATGPLFKHQQSTQTEYSTQPNLTASQSDPHASYSQASGPSPTPALVSSGSIVSQPQPVAGVPSHMHFLCDVLPCPIQSSHTGRKQMISQDVCMSRCTPKAPENILPDEPVHEPTPLSKPTSSEAKRGGATSHPQRPERKKKEKVSKKDTEMVITTRKQKKSSVDTGDTEVPDSKTESVSRERVAQHLEQKRQKVRRDVSDEAAAPSSPVHSTLGQVVSEVLFPSVVSSSPAHRPPVSNGPVLPSSAASQPSDPPCDTHNSMEVIAQLLQEAEDSDGKEFEDDPLLQVLRKQRMWIREQISQVDSVFNELQDMQVLLH